MAVFVTLTLLGLLWSGSAAADQCKPAGATCNANQSCCGSGGRTKGVCVKAPGAKFGVCCSPTAAEVCDGRDNNCNGRIDENLGSTTCGDGVCAHTVQNCVGGVPQTCDPSATDGNGCDDGDACTQTDSCQGGICNGSGEVFCPPSPVECQSATCVSPTGCELTDDPDGTPCGFYLDRTCRNGVCECLPVNADCESADSCCSLRCCEPNAALGGAGGYCCETK